MKTDRFSRPPEFLSHEEIRDGHKLHGARAQLYRWFSYNDRAGPTPVEHHLETVDEGFELRSGIIEELESDGRLAGDTGQPSGRDAYRRHLDRLPAHWRNAHFLAEPALSFERDGNIALIAEAKCLNTGVDPTGGVLGIDARYTTRLTFEGDALLPQFSEMTIEQLTEPRAVDGFTSSYIENRVKSLMHCWHATIENPERHADWFEPILARNFTIVFPTGTLRSIGDIAQWLTEHVADFEAGLHFQNDLAISLQADGSYEVNAVCDFQAFTPDKTDITARVRYHWIVTDDPRERFARIARFDAEMLVPPTPRA